MSGLTAFRLSQGFYWLALGTWFGALVMLVLAAMTTFRTVRDYRPTLGLEPYNHPALAEHAPGILAGAITGGTLKKLAVLQLVCAIVAVACVAAQTTAFADQLRDGGRHGSNYLRIGLIVLPFVVLAIDQLALSPRIWRHRELMYNPALSAAERDEARAVFMKYHKLSERLVGVAAVSVAAAVIVSPFAFRGAPPRESPQSPAVPVEGAARG